MELFVPYLLIVIGFDPAQPSETMALQHSLHASEQACEQVGAAFIQRRNGVDPAAHYRYFCIPAPSDADLQDVFDRSAGKGE